MPEYLSPGVYVEEVSSGIKPIEGVGTSTGAFAGGAVKGPVSTPVLITNFTQFVSTFGSFHPSFFLAYAVRHFFLEGGTRCYVVRAFRPSPAPGVADHPAGVPQDSAFVELLGGGSPVLRVVAANQGAWGNDLTVVVGPPAFDPADAANALQRFSLRVQVRRPGAPNETVETFDPLSLQEFTPNNLPNPFHAENRINGTSQSIRVSDLSAAPANITPPAAGSFNLAGGANGQTLRRDELVGDEAAGTGLWAFARVDDVNIVAIPDLMSLAAADARVGTLDALTFCERRKDCFFVADAPSGLTPQSVLAYKQAQAPFSGNPFNSSFGALYYPWIQVADPVTGGLRLCPPSGAVAGTYSFTDVRRGVHKAPAGTEEGFLNAAADVERVLTTGEQDTLNPRGINVIRKFPEAGIVVWGARTLSADPEWKYVNVRRLFLFLEESIDEGTQWVVFEPNDPVLWKRIVRNIGAFLRVQWREGKLVGNKEEEAFFVKCDAETNPPESVDLGRVVTVIGVAPSKPAEFVIFRISQFRPGA
jgi:uncharacterized protein